MTSSQTELELQRRTEEVYRFNRTITKQNKTLEILTRLYTIGTRQMLPDALSREVSAHVRETCEYDYVAVASYDHATRRVTVVGDACSARFETTRANAPQQRTLEFTHTPDDTFFSRLTAPYAPIYQCPPHTFFSNSSPEQLAAYAAEGHVRLMYCAPLLHDGVCAGFLVIGCNRTIGLSVSHEADMVHKIGLVVSTLLAKAYDYAALVASNAELTRVSEQKSAFLSFAAHQLRTPLQAVVGYLSLLRDGSFGALPQSASQPVANILTSATAMSRTIDDFLDASKIEQGTMQYMKELFDMRELVHAVVFEQMIHAKERAVTLTEASCATACAVNGDKAKIKHVLINVIDNAVKYTPRGSVTVSVTEGDAHVRVTIVDTGVGIAPEDLTRVFGKFTRGATATKNKIAGTGIGLYIAKEIIDAHGGSIAIASPGVGKGSTCVVTLPMSTEV